MTKVKICGLSRLADIQTANLLQLDYIGFVFAKSKRQVSPSEARYLKTQLSPSILAVGVFVNHPLEAIFALLQAGTIDLVQLHGQEPDGDIVALKNAFPQVKIIRSISVSTRQDVLDGETSSADYLLLDNGKGGTGKAFDWGILPQLQGLTKPYFIAGGLDPHNVKALLPHCPFGVDVSGGVETDGAKDPQKMKKFTDEVRT